MRWGEGGAEETPSARRRLRERRSFESTALRTRETQSVEGVRGRGREVAPLSVGEGG
jgi:hypothetical protein